MIVAAKLDRPLRRARKGFSRARTHSP